MRARARFRACVLVRAYVHAGVFVRVCARGARVCACTARTPARRARRRELPLKRRVCPWASPTADPSDYGAPGLVPARPFPAFSLRYGSEGSLWSLEVC